MVSEVGLVSILHWKGNGNEQHILGCTETTIV